MMAANYRHIGGQENRLGRHYSRFPSYAPAAPLCVNHLQRKNSAAAGRIGEVRLDWQGCIIARKSLSLFDRRTPSVTGIMQHIGVSDHIRLLVRADEGDRMIDRRKIIALFGGAILASPLEV